MDSGLTGKRSVPLWGAILFWMGAAALLGWSGRGFYRGARDLDRWRGALPGTLSSVGPSAPVEENPAFPLPATRPVTFRLLAPAAQSVFIGGTFNDFDATRHALTRHADGLWEITIPLPMGPCLYKFKVDGQWELDPTNPDRTPAPRECSLLEVTP